MLPNAPTANLANIPLQVAEIYTLSTSRPIDSAQNLHFLLHQEVVPSLDFLWRGDCEAEVLVQTSSNLKSTWGGIRLVDSFRRGEQLENVW